MSQPTYARISKVLVVEDNDGLREVLCQQLLSLGLNIVEAEDGVNAVRILETQSIDLLITDFRMPLMNGVELLSWCRTRPLHLPVIFLSSEADLIPSEQVALGDCCATMMLKPFTMEVLLAALGAADSRSHHQDCIHTLKGGVARQRPRRD